jgi:hypothetical protein
VIAALAYLARMAVEHDNDMLVVGELCGGRFLLRRRASHLPPHAPGLVRTDSGITA